MKTVRVNQFIDLAPYIQTSHIYSMTPTTSSPVTTLRFKITQPFHDGELVRKLDSLKETPSVEYKTMEEVKGHLKKLMSK